MSLTSFKCCTMACLEGTDPTTFALYGFSGSSDAVLNRLPSTDRLADADGRILTINGISVKPTFIYQGRNATSSSWTATVGQNLSAVGSGPPISASAGSPLLGSDDDSVMFNYGRYFQLTSGSVGQIATEDFVIEAIINPNAFVTTEAICATKGAGFGWDFRQDTTNRLLVLFTDSSGTSFVNSTNVIADNTWFHVLAFIDRDGSGAFYINGVEAGTRALSAPGDLTSPDQLTLGAGATGGILSPHSVAHLALWKRDDWLDTHLQADLAKERFMKLSGHWPHRALGTKAPVVATRTTAGYLDKVNPTTGIRELHYVGAHWMRCVDRPRSGSYATGSDILNAQRIKGALIEDDATNLILRSQEFDNASWTLVDSGDSVSADAVVAPNLALEGDALIPDTTNGVHGWTQPATHTNATHTFSVWVKAGSVEWITLQNLTVTNGYGQMRLSGSGVLGTKGSGCSRQSIEYYGNGWYRCSIVYTGILGVNTMRILAQVANNGFIMAGDGSTPAAYFWGAQVELGPAATSYIPTAGSTVARDDDSLYFKGDDGNINANGVGSIEFDQFTGNYDNNASKIAIGFSDGGSSADRITFYGDLASDISQIESAATAGSAGVVAGSTILSDGAIHALKATYQTDALNLYVDGSSDGTEDTSVDVPDDLDRIHIGSYVSNTLQLNGVVSELKLTRRPS